MSIGWTKANQILSNIFSRIWHIKLCWNWGAEFRVLISGLSSWVKNRLVSKHGLVLLHRLKYPIFVCSFSRAFFIEAKDIFASDVSVFLKASHWSYRFFRGNSRAKLKAICMLEHLGFSWGYEAFSNFGVCVSRLLPRKDQERHWVFASSWLRSCVNWWKHSFQFGACFVGQFKGLNSGCEARGSLVCLQQEYFLVDTLGRFIFLILPFRH